MALETQGTGGLESTHTWNDAVTLNARDAEPVRYKLNAIGGLYSLPDPEDLRDLATGRPGEIPRQSLRRGKTITYEGVIQGRSLEQMRAAVVDLTGAFHEMAEGVMEIEPVDPYPGSVRQFRARCLVVEVTEIQNAPPERWGGFERSFVIGLRLSDPRFYDSEIEVTEDTSTMTPLAGTAPPFTPPFTLAAPAAGVGEVIVDNPGSAPVDPVIDIYGPVTNPTVENVTLDASLIFNASGGLTIPDGQFLRVDFASRRILLQGQSDYRAKLNLIASDWWDPGVPGLVAGSNTIRVRGDAIADPAHVHIAFNPAHWS